MFKLYTEEEIKVMEENKELCIIGGAAGLIGAGLVKGFQKKDYLVQGFDLKNDSELNCNKLDLTSQDDITTAFRNIFLKKNFESVTLINCQGIADPYTSSIKDLSLETWNKYFQNNVTSYFLMCRELIRHEESFARASIINLSSTRHFMAEKDSECYGMSKGAIVSFTKSLAMSCNSGKVRVNSVSPGWIDKADAELSDEDKNQHPVNRVGTPEDIFNLCFYLSSLDSSFITGQDFVIDGGMSSKMIYK